MGDKTRFSVTVIIPTFNYGRYLRRAVDSVLSQNLSSLARIIVVDDGSTDDTPAIAATLGDRVQFIRQENQGVSAARNRGLEEVETEWVVFLDADDRLLPNALTRFEASVHEHSACRLHFGQHVSLAANGSRRTSRRQPEMGSPLDNFRRFILRQFTISTGTACYHRDVFQKIRYPVGITHGEHIVVDGQILANCPAATIPHALAEILDHPGRCRLNVNQLISNGFSTVAAMFDSDRLPAEAMELKPLFLARWNLTLARACYRSGDFQKARFYYEQAAVNRETALWHVTHGIRYLNSIVRTTSSLTAFKTLLSADARTKFWRRTTVPTR